MGRPYGKALGLPHYLFLSYLCICRESEKYMQKILKSIHSLQYIGTSIFRKKIVQSLYPWHNSCDSSISEISFVFFPGGPWIWKLALIDSLDQCSEINFKLNFAWEWGGVRKPASGFWRRENWTCSQREVSSQREGLSLSTGYSLKKRMKGEIAKEEILSPILTLSYVKTQKFVLV